MTKYRIYIDEVGNSDLGSSDNPNHRFLSLTGVILELGHIADCVHPQMEALKTKFFRSHPDDPIIFHRKEMLNARPPFEALKYDEVRRQFDKELLDLLAHPSRQEILCEHYLVERPPATFAQKVILILQQKYDQREGRIWGKKLL